MTDDDRQRLHFRAYPAQLQQTGKRTLSGRLVPYNEPADVVDQMPDGELEVYREGFRPGAFTPQMTDQGSVQKIGLIHRHEGGLGYLGPFIGLRDAPDGLYGDVRVLPSKASDVEALLDSGVRELSVEFRLPRTGHTTVDADGVRWRTRAHLDQVALEPRGAYSRAEVLAYRHEVDEAQREQSEAEQAAEAEAQAQAEAQAAQDAADAEARQRVEDAATALAERKRLWDEMTARTPAAVEKQQEYVRDFGLTKPGGWQRH